MPKFCSEISAQNWMQNLAQKFTFANSAQTLLCLGFRSILVVLVEKPRNVRFSRPSIGVSRFSMKNIRWAKAQGLGRGETGITHKTFREIKHAKTSCSLAQYRYETRQAKRSAAIPHFITLRFLYFIYFRFPRISPTR